MDDYVLLKKKKLDSYYNSDISSSFLKEFNLIFNKIPHIYSEIFLKLFQERYKYFVAFEKSFVVVSFERVLERLFYNINNDYDRDFFINYIEDDLIICFSDINNLDVVFEISECLSEILVSNVEIEVLLDIISNKLGDRNYWGYDVLDSRFKFSAHDKVVLYEIMDSYLIGKVLVRIVKILNIYNDNKGSKFYDLVKMGVEKFRTWDMIMDNVLDIYDSKYRSVISEDEFKILVYLIGLSKNGEDIDNSVDYNIDKLFDSLGFDTSMRQIIDYKRGFDYLEVCDSRVDSSVSSLFLYKNSPVIYEVVSDCLEVLFDKYYDDYNFIISKDRVLRKIFYLFIRNVNFYNKLFVCTNYKMWEYEWDSIKRKYEVSYLENNIINEDLNMSLVSLYKYKYDNVMTGLEFEIFLEELFLEYGYDVRRCGMSGDQGGDLLIVCNNLKYVVQAKFYTNSLGNDSVQEVLASLNFYGADKGVVITNSKFTKGAIELAYVNDVILIDGRRLVKIISNLFFKDRYKNGDIFYL